jgi:NAD(P)-dependent dehydrogenase (short-subunit alcohol dehydrogenase family)
MPGKQVPLHSGFGHSTTAMQVLEGIELSRKVVIVTGGYSGIGLETTRALAEAGATVIVPARDPKKALGALEAVRVAELARLDLRNPASIDCFASEFLRSGRPLHLLINNAGIMAVPLTRDERGYEAQFEVNHLGHFQLTMRLWPALLRAGHARVVSLSSAAHHLSGVDFDDPNFERREYNKWVAYGQSKTANSLFAVGVDSRGEAHGVRAFAVHPGRIVTPLQRYIPLRELQALGFRDDAGQVPVEQRALYKTIQQGAATTVWCATSPMLEGMGGVYCEDVDVACAVPDDHRELTGVKAWATDPALAERLWGMSELMTGVGLS